MNHHTNRQCLRQPPDRPSPLHSISALPWLPKYRISIVFRRISRLLGGCLNGIYFTTECNDTKVSQPRADTPDNQTQYIQFTQENSGFRSINRTS
jgi:hypothetical protein